MANPGGLVFTVHIAKRMDERYGSSCFSAERLRGRKACGKFAARPQALALAIAASDAPHRPATLHVLYANAGSDRDHRPPGND